MLTGRWCLLAGVVQDCPTLGVSGPPSSELTNQQPCEELFPTSTDYDSNFYGIWKNPGQSSLACYALNLTDPHGWHITQDPCGAGQQCNWMYYNRDCVELLDFLHIPNYTNIYPIGGGGANGEPGTFHPHEE